MNLRSFKRHIGDNPIVTPSGIMLAWNKEYLVKSTYPVSLVFDWFKEISESQSSIILDGDRISIGSLRIQTFLQHGAFCAICGLEGKFFSKEKMWNEDKEVYHLNLYGIRANSDVAMLTMDHIEAKSRGGKNSLDNTQTLCRSCNEKKGSMPFDEFQAIMAETRGQRLYIHS